MDRTMTHHTRSHATITPTSPTEAEAGWSQSAVRERGGPPASIIVQAQRKICPHPDPYPVQWLYPRGTKSSSAPRGDPGISWSLRISYSTFILETSNGWGPWRTTLAHRSFGGILGADHRAGDESRNSIRQGVQGEMDNIFLIQNLSTGNCRGISLGEVWDRTKEALFLRSSAAVVTAGVRV